MIKEIEKHSLVKTHPTLFADDHDGKRSNRYSFIKTESVIDSFDKAGWGISKVMVPAVRKADPEHCKHQVFFRNRDETHRFLDPRSRNADRPIFPEILFTNSSDGTSSVDFLAGLFIQICSNGAVISGGDFAFFKHSHVRFDTSDAVTMAAQFLEKVQLIFSTIRKFAEVELSIEEQHMFAEQAGLIRWGEKKAEPDQILNRRRLEDRGNDLWTVYNVVQENLIMGGIKSMSRRQTRGINNIRSYNQTNEQLWALAEIFTQ